MTVRFEKKALGTSTTCLFRTEMPVRFQDVDAAGIVFFARMFDYVHGAYEEFLAQTGNALAEVIADRRWAAPLRHAEADYLSPARFGDRLIVELVAGESSETEIALGWRITKKGASSPPAAVVQTVHAFVSVPSFERMKVPSEIVDALKPAP